MTARQEIEKRLSDWANSQSPPIPISFENVAFTKPSDGCYLSIFFIGDDRKNRNLSAEVRLTGMFQINCHAPLNKGMAEVEALRDNIINLFPVLPKTGTVSIESPLSPSGSYEDNDNFVCIPVRARYRIEL